MHLDDMDKDEFGVVLHGKGQGDAGQAGNGPGMDMDKPGCCTPSFRSAPGP
jgi:hypothetical protein